jgi:phosphoserine phosphatase
MEKLSIIWDFDGTILPSAPFDSEQSLLRYRMYQPEKPFSWLKKRCAQAIIYADRRERFRKTFKKVFVRLLKGTPASTLDEVCRNLAQKISTADRRVLKELKNTGYDMVVLSCGTADLSERVLKYAELKDCFRLIEGNRFRFNQDQITGMNFHIPDPEDKLRFAKNLKLSPHRTIVVGDGYTDLPLLNWSSIPVMLDRTGQKKKRFTSHHFYFISGIPELMNVIETNITQR